MNQEELFLYLKREFKRILDEKDIGRDEISVNSRALTPEEAIGKTGRKDYPILTGKEIMLEAEYRGARGQAFTDSPAEFRGTIDEILNMDIVNDPHSRGVFIATLNAVMNYEGLADRTVHCRNNEPEECAKKTVNFIKENYGDVKIALVGYQPALLENLSKNFDVRVLDLNPQNVGQIKYGVRVENGKDDFTDVVVKWAELVLCTGSTLCNGTITQFLNTGKETFFFGTTLAGASQILGCRRMCFMATED